jgi:hypothetical protein
MLLVFLRNAIELLSELGIIAQARHGLILFYKRLFGANLVFKGRKLFCGEICHIFSSLSLRNTGLVLHKNRAAMHMAGYFKTPSRV